MIGLARLLLPLLDDVLTEARVTMLDVHEKLADLHDYVQVARELAEAPR
jgi:hypothetical protein